MSWMSGIVAHSSKQPKVATQIHPGSRSVSCPWSRALRSYSSSLIDSCNKKGKTGKSVFFSDIFGLFVKLRTNHAD
jgi:hypothetical protein